MVTLNKLLQLLKDLETTMLIVSCLILEFLTLYFCDGYKILVVFPIPSKSHAILGDAVVRILLEGGHQVTYITPYTNIDPVSNLSQIDVSANKEVFVGTAFDIKLVMNKIIDKKNPNILMQFLHTVSDATLINENVQKLLKDPSQEFDLVVAEWLISDMYAVLPSIYACPLIWFSTIETHWIILSLIDESLNPAYNSDYMISYSLPFTFSQRIHALWRQIVWRYYSNYKFYRHQENNYESLIVPILRARGKAVPTFEELRYNASLVLANSHVSSGQATRLPQNYKPIGGYHLEFDMKPLTQHLKRIMDNSKNGVIYFSLGSNLRSKDLPDKIKHSLLKVFGNFKQTILWKFEENLSNLPKNVHILKWAPQESILSHPNCILFINHGGILSIAEAIHYGVPIIGIPIYGDQFKNVDTAVRNGIGIRVDMSYNVADEIKNAVLKMTRNSSYQINMKELSLVHHDRLISPRVELLYWVEYVIRTRGAPLLRSPALNIPWYQKIYLDLMAALLAAQYILKILLRRIYCKIMTKIKKTKDKLN